jgi:hypothetical protein
VLPAFVFVVALAPDPAQTVLDRVGDAVADGRHEDALRITQEDYDERGDHRSLFIMGEIEIHRGRCSSAISYYERFLATDPAQQDRVRTEERVAECTAQAAEPEPEPLPAPPAPSVARPSPTPPEPTPPRHRHWYADPVGGTFFATGIAALAIGAGFYGRASVDRRRANGAATLDEYLQLRDRPILFSKVGIGLLAVGGALTAASIIVYVVRARRGRRATSSALTHMRARH